MAVKVMVAPAIAAAVEAPPVRKARDPLAPPKPRRRKSAVYDCDGHEVLITLMCLKCHQMRPLSQFGLRRMADGSIRNQPWCRTCRSAPSAKAEAEAKAADEAASAGESPVPPPSPAAHPAAKPPERRRPGAVAAEVAAALLGGRG